jgi:hypothetical protein
MALNLNTAPYFDDFDVNKNYNRILFKPGVAVQARELTQLQTILQNQISSIGSYTLKEGAIISGCEESISVVDYIKINDVDNSSVALINSQLVNFIGEEVTGGTTGLKAKIVDVRQGSQAGAPDFKTLYLSYTSFGGGTDRHFSAGEVLTISSNGNYRGKTFVVEDTAGSTLGNRFHGVTTKIQLSPGIIYAKGQFLKTDALSTYVSPFNNSVRAKIGFVVTESIVGSSDDNTLTDPATGSFNFAAPGADRYKLTVTLESYLVNVATSDDFYQYAEFEYGNIIRSRVLSDPLNQLGDQIAKRAYEANGNYVVNGLLVSVKEHLNDGVNKGVFTNDESGDANGGLATKLAVFIESGKANVGGYLRELKSPQLIAIDKPSSFNTIEDSTLTTSYGNYVNVNEFCGAWDVDGGEPVILYDNARDSITNGVFSTLPALTAPVAIGGTAGQFTCGNSNIVVGDLITITGTLGGTGTITGYTTGTVYKVSAKTGTAPSVTGFTLTTVAGAAIATTAGTLTGLTYTVSSVFGNRIGTAKLRHFVLDSGTAGTAAAQYRMYLYDIKMESGDFKDVRSIYYDATLAYGIADIVLVDGNAVLNEEEYNKFLWRLPKIAIKTLRAVDNAYGYNFQYTKEFDVSLDASGNLPLQLTGNESFTFGNGSVSDTARAANIQMVARDSFDIGATSIVAGQYIDILSSGAFTATVEQTSATSIEIDVPNITGSDRKVKVYVTVKVSNTTPIAKSLVVDRYVRIDTGMHPLSTSGDYTLGVSDLFRVVQITATTNADYTTGAEDVTDQFRVDNGQTDNFYGLASIKLKASSTLNLTTKRYIQVKYDKFTRTVSGPSFACVNSYPVDDTGNTGIKTEEIPLYISPTRGVFDLRNCIDFRPYVTDTAVGADTAGSATVNPSLDSIIARPSNGLTNPVPVQEFTTDLQYYLAQGARVVLDNTGEFRVVLGPQNERVDIPSPEGNQMTLATFIMPPYPSLAASAAKIYNRPDLAIKVSQVENSRYTMRDISALEKRIKNLEYYTSLSLLEKEAKDYKILDSNGVDRFKNGLLVDPFRGHGVAAVSHPDFKCSIDNAKQELRAYFSDDTVDFRPISTGQQPGAAQSTSVFHVPYTEVVYTEQLQASKASPIVIELLYANISPNTPSETVIVPSATTSSAPENSTSASYESNILVYNNVTPEAPVFIAATGEPEILDPVVIPDPPAATPALPVLPPATPIAEEISPPLPKPLYLLVRSDSAVDEGGSVTITVVTTNALPGTTVGYTVTGIGAGDLDAGSAPLTGTLTLSSGGTAEVTFFIANDALTELSEILYFTLADQDSLGNWTSGSVGSPGRSTLVTINDTSTTVSGVPIPNTPYVLNTAETAAIPPTCGAGTVWSASEQACIPVFIPQSFAGTLIITPSEDRWHDTEYVEPTYNNKTGSYDQFAYNDAWNVTWNGWTQVDIDIKTEVIDVGSPQVGVTFDGQTEYYEGGSFYTTFTEYTSYQQTITSTTERGFETGISSYSGSLPEDRIESVGEKTINTTIVAYARPIVITGYVTGLAPNAEHTVTMGGILKTTFTTDSQGSASGSVSIGSGEFKTGPIDILITGTSSYGTNSAASAIFYSGGTINQLQQQYDRVRAPQPANKFIQGPVVTRESTTFGDLKTYTTPIAIQTTYQTTFVEPVTTNTETIETVSCFPLQIDPLATLDSVVITDTNINPTITITDSYNDYYHGDNAESYPVVSLPSENFTITGDTAITVEPINTNISFDYDFSFFADDAALAEYNYYYQPGMYGGFCGFGDPMAQTFTVDNISGGMYVSSVDLFFKSVSREGDNNGITLELREVINGYPGPTVIPGGSVHKFRSDCSVSVTTGSSTEFKGTKFQFPIPVYLEAGKEYCIVPIPDADDPNYEVWIAELGASQFGTSKTISKQAHTGILFTSANNRTWTAHQSEDMMFRINRCNFRTNRDYIVTLKNENVDWLEFSNFSSGTEFTMGSFIHNFTFTITNGGTGYTSAPNVQFSGGGGGSGAAATAILTDGVVTGITLTNPGTGYLSNPTVTLTGGGGSGATVTAVLNRAKIIRNSTKYSSTTALLVNGNFSTSNAAPNLARTLVGDGTRTATISSINDRVVDAYVLKAKSENHANLGKITPKIALANTGVGTIVPTTETTIANTTVELSAEKTILSYSNEIATFAAGDPHKKSATIEFVLNTTVNNLSPMVNVETLILAIFKNEINSVDSVASFNEEVRVGGSATSKYISRKVVLAEGQDAEDLIVYLDNKIPTEGDVKVYAKFKNAADDGDFLEDIFWKELEILDGPFNTASQAYGEYSYKIPTKASGSGLNSGTDIFEYDVSRISSIAVTAGGSGFNTVPTVTISGAGGYGATATATLTGTALTAINILNPGRGYGGTLAGVAISGTAGQFTCTAANLAIGDTLTITGTLGGTGSITSYSTGTSYKVSAVTGSAGAVTGFTLQTTSSVAIVTTAGTPTGLTYTFVPTVTIVYGGPLAGVAISGTAGQFTCTATNLAVNDTLKITGTLGGTGTITGYATGTTYKVSSVTGSVGAVTGFTLQTTSSVAIVTTAGTPSGLTYTVVPTPGSGGSSATAIASRSTITYTGYKEYAIKIVHLSTNSARIPKSTNLRAYALQV